MATKLLQDPCICQYAIADGCTRDFIVSVADKCRFLLSNSDCADGFFDRLYGDFRIERIRVPRTINSIGARRGEISEIIVSPSL